MIELNFNIMMSLNVIAVGRLKERFYIDAAKEYIKMISGYAKIKVTEIEAARLPENPSEKEIEAALAAEAVKIRNAVGSGGFTIAMCVEGKQAPSEKFADILNNCALSGRSAVNFLIGGSFGISEEVKKRADLCLSMSEMTFPHRLARIMLLEQIYRAFSIINGKKYHK